MRSQTAGGDSRERDVGNVFGGEKEWWNGGKCDGASQAAEEEVIVIRQSGSGHGVFWRRKRHFGLRLFCFAKDLTQIDLTEKAGTPLRSAVPQVLTCPCHQHSISQPQTS